MRNRLLLVLSVALIGLAMMGFSSNSTVSANEGNVSAYSSKIESDQMMTVIFSPKAKKLGVVIKDDAGKNLEGYIISDVAEISGTYNLSKAKKFGNSKILGNKIKLSRNGEGNLELFVNESKVPFKFEQNTAVKNEFADSNLSCWWVCDGSKDYDWWECFKWCLISPTC